MLFFSRENGVMFSISFWQWVLEMVFMAIMRIHLYLSVGSNKFIDELMTVYVYFHLSTINAFYLFGDRDFQRSVIKFGFVRALWRLD